MNRLIAVRHGESVWNRAGLLQGQSAAAPGLTELGRRQARDAAATVERMCGAVDVLLMTSDLERARETAMIIGARLGTAFSEDSRLRERGYGGWESRPRIEFEATAKFAERLPVGVIAEDAWAARHGRPAESLEAVASRVRSLLDDLVPATGDIVVVTHGDVIRVLTHMLMGRPGDALPDYVANGAVVSWDWNKIGTPSD